MAGGGGSGSGGARPSDKTARAPTIHSTIQSIKEVVGGHSDADIYDALRESNMDPNETAQKLLNQDPFHEVKRKRDKKRESAGHKSVAEAATQVDNSSQRMKPHTQKVGNDQRRAYNQGQTYGPSREFRVVRDNRHGVVENRSELGHKGSTYTQVSDRSGVVVQTDQNRPPATTSEGQIRHQTGKNSHNSSMLQVNREAQATAQRHAKPYKNSQKEHHLPYSDPSYASSNYKAVGGSVGANRREAGVVNAPRQYSGRPGSQLHVSSGTYHANIRRENFASAGPSSRPSAFMSRNALPNHRHALDTVSRGRSVGRPFVNHSINKYHQVPASNQKVKEWKPKSTTKSATNDTDNSRTDAVPPLDNKTESADVLDVNSLCDKTSHANLHEMEHVIIPEHLRVPEYEQTRLRFGSFTPGFDSDQLPALTSPESEQPVQLGEPLPELVVEEDAFGAEHDEGDDQAGSQLTNSTATAEISLSPSEDSEQMSGQEVEDDDGLGIVQSDTPLGATDDHNIHSTSSLAAFSTYTHEDSNSDAQLYGLVQPSVHQQVLASSSQGYTSVNPEADSVQAFRMPESNVHSQVLPSTSEALSSQLVSSSPIAISSQQQHISQQQQTTQMYPPIHVQHYPNFMPYRHPLYPPVYVPPMAMPNYSTNVPYASNGNNYLQMPAGGSHLTAGQVKYGVSQYKPVPTGNPSGYGNYTHPAGFTISSPGVIGAAVGVDDVNRMKYKDNNIYAQTPQVEASDIWIQTPREMPTLQCPPYYNISGQATPGAYMANPGNASYNATAQSSHAQFAGMYHQQQPPSIVSPHAMVHQQVPSAIGPNVGVGVAAPGPQVGAYQQPQLGHMNWRQPNF
ncbi:uncharacterized protein LOC100833454 isoform X2 [Brachypodium distachyon]|uniref:GBF-interacting protein 1 N-terminal domain-containing protein n=1 Tax=Brachypodium distachyon TaxID=15368 RepID=A0A0Q3H7U6_BRADI|nr:uncharacterized protein LOC100833454 isoform X2 [Brachypodium distachyon]KQK19096.1 hypothetical protein BRADI_1g46360v3 [Brachypodium distachyon]|eukprot:XP_010227879.1 uncharacterized protein LOC100833454 isoform X2 [Brachypodium distachyon]